MITIEEYFMGRDVSHANEYKPIIKEAAQRLIWRVNSLLFAINYGPVVVSSGWRPPTINALTKGASVNSRHITGHAVDIWDPEHTLCDTITQELLTIHKLWMESPSKTPTWCHLQDIPPGSGNRIFLP